MDWTKVFLSILLLPLVAALVNMLFLRRNGTTAALVSITAAFFSMVLAMIALFKCTEKYSVSFPWLSLGDFQASMGIYYNPMTATMLFVVTFVGFLIHVFSVGYMSDDPAKGRFFTGLSIFMFSMLGIVLADNLIMMFVFWELVGFSSYMLIAHYWNTEEARSACKKAFIMNRIGDFGMLLGIAWTYWHYKTVNLQALEVFSSQPGFVIHGGIALLLICGFIGKSAQFPLHTWLPDAMAGPTPVSALIHAATMVAAGIYFLCRIFCILDAQTLEVIVWLGSGMVVYAGICAFAQTDIKKILAYSTLSQLGYMAAAVGLGFPGLALFHTTTHAFFKALLFLGSGSVIHACHHEQDIFKMGGLFKKMPLTTALFAIGTIALCGVMFTSGYFSKDAIIEVAYFKNTPVFILLILGAFLTAGYMGRLFYVAFLGSPKSQNSEHAHESGFFMLVSLVVLAGMSLIGGYTQGWAPFARQLVSGELDTVHHQIVSLQAEGLFSVLGILPWAIGFAIALLFYGIGAKKDALQNHLPSVYSFVNQKLWFDEIYGFYVRNVQQRFADILNFCDVVLVGGLLVRGTAGLVGVVGMMARSLHVGNIHIYVYWFLAGLIIYWSFAMGYF